MSDRDLVRSAWLGDQDVLARVGAELFKQPTEIEVRPPKALADLAVAAWQREEVDFDLGDESLEETIVRHRAGSLGLIGCALEERGRLEGDDVVVKLDAWFIGDALNAADDAGLINP